MTPDRELLRQFVDERAEPALAELIRRHVDLVFSAALRQVDGDTHFAQDVVQHVFIDLVRKAHVLRHRETLEGWLYTSTHYAASNIVRAERRRRRHEQEAVTMAEPASMTPPADWAQLRPILDQAIHQLSESDREAVLLRYFARKPLAEIGTRLGLSENAAAKRVERALEKLHVLLGRRGVTSTASALGVALANQAVATAPAGLAASIVSAALSGAAAGGAGSLAAVIAFMSASKISLSVAAAGALAIVTAVYQTNQARAATAARAEMQRGNATLGARFTELEKNVSAAEQEQALREAALQRLRAEKAAAVATPAAAAPVDDINAKYREIVNRLTQNDAELPKARKVHDRMQTADGYRPLFRRLDFTPEQMEHALDILVKPLAQARDEFRATFGEAAGDQLAEFISLGASGARNLVNDLSAKLYFADAPFTPQQTEQLIRIVKDTSIEPLPRRQSSGNPSYVIRSTQDWDRIQAQAASLLAPEQLRGLSALAAHSRNIELLAAAANDAATTKP